jgi:hypothetical protein
MLGRTLLFTCCALVVLGFILSAASVSVAEDGWQWRINELDSGKLLLAFSEFEATDDLSGLRYYCQRSSGSIEVVGVMDEKQRRAFADLIRSNDYPQVKDEGSTVGLSFSDDGGWEYRFEIAADGASFNKFRQTGQFGFKLASIVVDNGVRKAGLGKISEFQAICRKPPASQVSNGPKGQK